MSIDVELLRDNRLIVLHFIGTLDLTECMQLVRKLYADYFDQATKPIHLIVDLTQSQGLPRNVLSNSLSVAKMSHRNSGKIIFVATNYLFIRFIEMFLHMTRDPNYQFCKTVAEATAKIDVVLQGDVPSDAAIDRAVAS